MTGKELTTIPLGSDSPMLALRMGDDELKNIIQANIGSATIDAGMLDRVKMPSGGAKFWEVPTLDGEQSAKSLDGVIIHWGTRRVKWASKYGEGEDGELPQCRSEDGFKGVGDPGGDCMGCPLNVFPEEGGPKPCIEQRQLFLLQEDSIIPLILNVTPGSLRALSQYFMRLLRGGVASTDIITKMALEVIKNKDNQEFSRIVPSAGARLEPAAAARIRDLAEKLEGAFTRASADFSRGVDDDAGSGEE